MDNSRDGAKQLDLDQLPKDFLLWQNYVLDLEKKNLLQKEQLEALHVKLSFGQSEITKNSEEIANLRAEVKSLQRMLSQRCHMEDENRNLRRDIEDVKLRLEEKIKDMKQQAAEYNTNIEDLQVMHKAELALQEESMTKKAKKELSANEKQIKEKELEITSLKAKMANTENEKRAEIDKLRLEYDSKLMKIQKQVVKAQQSGQTSTASQDIFRKKLQHVKTEYEKELIQQKHVIAELQQQLQAASKQTVVHAAPKRRKLFSHHINVMND